MSHTQSIASSSFNFGRLFDNALKEYQKRTKHDLLVHPLAAQLQACDSSTAIRALLFRQVQELDQSQNRDERLSKWLDPTVNVLYAFSATLGEGVGLVFSPAKVVFAGVGVLLLVAKDVQTSQATLADVFERIESFFRRLEIYTNVPTTTEMMDTIIQILVEVLCILGIATKEIKESRTKKYIKKLFGRTDLEDGLKRLDKLTQDEARMATAEVLKATHTVDERVRGVANDVHGVDDRVARVDKRVGDVDDRVASVGEQVVNVDNRVLSVDNKVIGLDNRVGGVDDRVIGIGDDVKEVGDKVVMVIDQGNEAKEVTQQIANNIDHVKQNQLRESIYKWLSPPDPSTNHNIARGTHHKGTAAWFFEGSIFREWKTTGSLLWIYGKPGSGKSVLCSTIIEDIAAMCEAGQASMAYFYFDFRNVNKQHLHDLIASLLIQLSAHSHPRCDILSRLYQAHDNGKTQPSDLVLVNCLKQMFSLPDQGPIYLVIDALDECSDASGIPSPRERVLQLVKELVELHLPNLHVCVTSRPEVDIRDIFEPLTNLRVSLHNESGQKQDILNYVKSIVYSDSERIMKRWKTEDKDLVIETLSERADGMFRWIFCQLEMLRHCLPPSVRRTLKELPESLDETYERILKEIKRPNRDHAHRILQCLVVAVRPLEVEELAEVLAVDFDNMEGIATLKPSWRWEDEEQALLSSCSSLITIVASRYSRVVQFSHFSVKEFLTSPRFASSCADISRYHIAFKPAHTIMGQACLGVLLRSDGPFRNGIRKTSPLAEYAAEHWVTHAQFEDVSSYLRKPMEYLFDLDKPYFAAWLELHNVDHDPELGSTFYIFSRTVRSRWDATPLYYAALCGFHDLAEHIIAMYPQQVNAMGGYYVTPLVAALANEHFRVAELLLRHGAGTTVNARGYDERIPLHSAAYYGDLDAVRLLLKHNADVNSQDILGQTSLHFAGRPCYHRKGPNVPQRLVNIARLLLEYGADVNALNHEGDTPLHLTARFGTVEVVSVLLEHGANVDEEDGEGKTPFQRALERKQNEIINLLSEHGAKSSR